MRKLIVPAFLLASAPVALAQDVAAPPAQPAPNAAAPVGERADWCEAYATWLVQMTPSEDPPPTDARPTQRLEVEMNSCTIDPQGYERETRAEADHAAEVASG